MALVAVTITGVYKSPDGTLLTGEVIQFDPVAVFGDAGTLVPTQRISVTTHETTAVYSVVLYTTDIPSAYVRYQVRLLVAGKVEDRKKFDLTDDLASVSLDTLINAYDPAQIAADSVLWLNHEGRIDVLEAASGSGVSDGDKGDVTVSGSGAVWTIDNDAVTNAKLGNMATKTYKGRTQGTSGDPEDVPVATLKTDLTLVKGDVGLSNVDNTSDVNKPVSSATQTALDAKADLVGGLVPSAQLPSFVDDVLEAANFAALPGTGATEKIYVTLDDNKTYRWSGSAYVEISASLALGETSATAYRGDRGKTAYDHSQLIADNPHNVSDANIVTTDVVTNNATTTKHGFLKKLSNVSTEFMNGQGDWAVPAGGGGGLANVVEDLTPQLGGNLDANTSNIDFDGNTGIRDDSGNEQLIFQKTASAVNHVEMTNAATGNAPEVAAAGGDTNIDLVLKGKGTGVVRINGGAGAGIIGLNDTDASHKLNITPGSNLTADRTLTITTGDSNRTVTINGDTTLSGTNTGDQTSIAGITGTKAQFDTAVTDGNFVYQGIHTGFPVEIGIACSDETTAITTGVGKATFRMPYAMTLTSVRASVTTAPTGANIIIDINDGGTSIMTTNKLSIDATEKTSTTAATAHTLTDTALADDAEITIDFDQVGSTIAGAGVKVWLLGTRT